MALSDVLAKMIVIISANTAEFARGLSDTSNKLNEFSRTLTRISGTLGVTFGTQQIASFIKESAVLAGEVAGVKGAFDRLANSQNVLQDLKDATRRTVSELELMKNAVQANNFQIPIEQLASLFKFATLRAQQTGQSVDYLVQSIVTGIGRKSPLILDNLGISAVRLREKLKGVGTEAATVGDVAKVVGDIAEEELGNMAGFSENASTKIQTLSASWDNLKASIGKAVGGQKGFFTDVIDATKTWVDLLNRSEFDKFLVLQTDLARQLKAVQKDSEVIDELVAKLQKLRNEFGILADDARTMNIARGFKLSDEQAAIFFQTMRKINGEIKATTSTISEFTKVDTLTTLEAQLKQLNEDFENINLTNKEGLAIKGKEIIALDAQIKKLNELRKAQEDQATGLSAVRVKLAEVIKDLEATDLADNKRLNNLRQQRQALEQLVKSQENLNKVKNESILIDTTAVKLEPTTNGNRVGADGKGFKLFEFKDEDVEKMIASLRKVKTEMKSFADTSIEIGGIVSGAIVDMANAFGSLTNKSTNFGEAIVQVAAGFAQQFGAILIAAGVAKISFDTFKGPAMIAAGAALVALGAAAKGVIANRPNLSKANTGSSASSNTTAFASSQTGGLVSLIPEGEWRISGRDLVFVYDKNKELDGSRVGGSRRG